MPPPRASEISADNPPLAVLSLGMWRETRVPVPSFLLLNFAEHLLGQALGSPPGWAWLCNEIVGKGQPCFL